MRRIIFILTFLFFVFSMPMAGLAADVDVNIGIDPYDQELEPLPPLETGGEIYVPPPMQFEGEPDIVVVPSGTSYVYMVPNTPGLYFYHGRWYRYYEGYWFRSSIYNGSWVYIDSSLVPRLILDVPPEYILYVPMDYHRIHYRDFHRGWRSWDRDRHWNRYDWFKRELRHDIRRDRFNRIRGERDRIHIDRDRGRGRDDRDRGRGDRDRGRKDGTTINRGTHETPWEKGMRSRGTTIDRGTRDRGTKIDKGTRDRGTTIDRGTRDRGTKIDKGTRDRGTKIDKGTRDRGKTIDKGTRDSETKKDKGTHETPWEKGTRR